MTPIPFTKMHGCGNDYIYVNTIHHHIPNPTQAAIEWSDRHKGIGSDGLVLIDRSPVPEADFTMHIYNADGSEAMMCGNACRCIGKYLYERNLTTKTDIRLLTLSGIKILHLHTDGPIVQSVTVDMGVPELQAPNLYNSQFPILNSQFPSLPHGTFVSMGNPHYVIFTQQLQDAQTQGSILEHHPAFPQRCNIEFAHITPNGIRTKVWERGSGITQACGTGACATAVAAVVTKQAPRQTQIIMDGGTLQVHWQQATNHVLLTGPANFVYDGTINV